MNKQNQQGNVLMTSMLIMVLMNIMGIGLVQASLRESNLASYRTIDAEVFHVTESCTYDVINYFEDQTTTPTTVPSINVTSLSSLLSTTTSQDILNKLDSYSYNCTVTYITSKVSDVSASDAGSEIGGAGGEYGSTGALSPKDYYQIVSTGTGPKNSTEVINTIISVEY